MEKVAVYLTKEEINFLWDVINKGVPVAEAVQDLVEDVELENLRSELLQGVAHFTTI